MPLAAFPKCFLDTLCVTGEMSVDQWVELADEIDVDGLEFYWRFLPSDDPDEWERLRQLVAKRGRTIPMLCYSPDFTHPDREDRRQEIAEQQAAIRGAKGLGARYCRVLSGQRRPEVTRSDGLSWVRQCLLELIPYAESQGITLILENHYKDGFWHYPEFAQQTDIFLELLESIPESPAFGVNYDPSNAIIAGEDPIALLVAVKDRVVTMHASDRYFEGGGLDDLRQHEAHPHTGYADILQHGVIGRGMNDYDRIFTILRDAGFRGWISIEDGPDPDTGVADLQESAIFLRTKMRAFGLE